MNNRSKIYLRRLIIGFVAYAAGIAAMKYFAWKLSDSPQRYWLILLPVLPIIYLVVTVIRRLSEQDEMWRKIITESLAFSAVATAWTCLSFVFLRDLGAPRFQPEWAFFMMVAYYVIGNLCIRRRYQ
ncbi:MAG: hypothetical protein ACK4UN_15100 [Limisphaerales bacterium]